MSLVNRTLFLSIDHLEENSTHACTITLQRSQVTTPDVFKNSPPSGKFAMIGCRLMRERKLTFASLAESSAHVLYFGQKNIMDVSSDMSKNIRVGRSEKSFFFFFIYFL